MHIVIIGNGIAGITAARWLRKLSDHKITVISGESEHFFSRTALMYVYMGQMRMEDTEPYEKWFWKENKINLRQEWVDEINFDQKEMTFITGECMNYDKLVLAVGSKTNKYNWVGQDLDGVHGLYNLQDLEAIERHSENLEQAVIVGGGLIGVEMAEMLHSRNIPVIFLVRESKYWNNILPPEESDMVTKHIREHGIDLRIETELKEIWGKKATEKAEMVVTSKGEKIPCGFVGLTAGVSPNIEFLIHSPLNIDKGIVVNEYLETNIPDVYAIGDCAQQQNPRKGRRAIEAVWYTGRMQGETVAYNICNKKVAYDPGIWFNSAKFFDIEYQVYGDIQANLPEDQATLYWEHKRGKKSIRINYEKESKAVVGFNLMGIRYRHEVCEKWLKDKTPIQEVLQNLSLANFDPEFYKTYEKHLVGLYNKQTGSSLKLQQNRNLNRVLRFLNNFNVSK